MLLYTILAFVGALVLRKQIAREFPDAPPVSARVALGQYAQTMGERIARARAAASPAAAPGPLSKAAELERLVALLDRGAITPEEYSAAKRELLGSL
jgi:hypothetical protein